MEFEEDEVFDNYVKAFKKLSINDKRKITIDELKRLIVLMQKLNYNHGLNSKMLFNREIVDINSDNYEEKDYVEAIFVYLKAAQELIASYIDNYEDK